MADKKCPNCGACKECGAGGYKPRPIPWGVYPYPYPAPHFQPYPSHYYQHPLRYQGTPAGNQINTVGNSLAGYNNYTAPQI